MPIVFAGLCQWLGFAVAARVDVCDVAGKVTDEIVYITTNGEKDMTFSAIERYMSIDDVSQIPGILEGNIMENSDENYR